MILIVNLKLIILFNKLISIKILDLFPIFTKDNKQ